jgi:hypothetical protein
LGEFFEDEFFGGGPAGHKGKRVEVGSRGDKEELLQR